MLRTYYADVTRPPPPRKTLWSKFSTATIFVGTTFWTLVSYIFTSTSTAGTTITDIVTGNTGRLIVVSVALSMLTTIASRHQVELGEAIDNRYCEVGPTRYAINNAVDLVGNEIEPYICV